MDLHLKELNKKYHIGSSHRAPKFILTTCKWPSSKRC